MNNSEIWIAITCYNKNKFVSAAIKSALNETPNIVVVDDFSTDGSRDLITTFNDIHVVMNTMNRGSSFSTKVAIERAAELGAKFVILLDGDDVLAPGTIEQYLSIFRETSADAIYTCGARSREKDVRGEVQGLDKIEPYLIIENSFQYWLDNPRASTCVGGTPSVLLADLHPAAPVQDNQIGMSTHRNANILVYSEAVTHYCSMAVGGQNLALNTRALAESWVVMYCVHYKKVLGKRGFPRFQNKCLTSAIRLRYVGELTPETIFLFYLIVPFKSVLPHKLKTWLIFRACKSSGLYNKL